MKQSSSSSSSSGPAGSPSKKETKASKKASSAAGVPIGLRVVGSGRGVVDDSETDGFLSKVCTHKVRAAVNDEGFHWAMAGAPDCQALGGVIGSRLAV